jgi:hypothetical protein
MRISPKNSAGRGEGRGGVESKYNKIKIKNKTI